jgi:hypothetical protein
MSLQAGSSLFGVVTALRDGIWEAATECQNYME